MSTIQRLVSHPSEQRRRTWLLPVQSMSAMASRYIDRPGCECCGLGVTTLVASIGLKVSNLPEIGVDAADVVQAIEGIEQLQALA